MNDSELIRCAGKGDAAAFRQIAEHYAGQVYLLSCSVTADELEGQEAVLDIFRTAWNAVPLLDSASSLPEWLAILTCQHFEKKLTGGAGSQRPPSDFLSLPPAQRFCHCLSAGCGFQQDAALHIMGRLYPSEPYEVTQSSWEAWYAGVNEAYPQNLPARIAGAVRQDNERYGWHKLLGRFRFTILALVLVLLLLLFTRMQSTGKASEAAQSAASVTSTAGQTTEALQPAPDAQLIPGS